MDHPNMAVTSLAGADLRRQCRDRLQRHLSALWRPKITGNSIVCWNVVHVNNIEIITGPQYCRIAMEIHLWLTKASDAKYVSMSWRYNEQPQTLIIRYLDVHPISNCCLSVLVVTYRQASNVSRALAGNKIVDHSDVVGASPVGAAPTTSSFSI